MDRRRRGLPLTLLYLLAVVLIVDGCGSSGGSDTPGSSGNGGTTTTVIPGPGEPENTNGNGTGPMAGLPPGPPPGSGNGNTNGNGSTRRPPPGPPPDGNGNFNGNFNGNGPAGPPPPPPPDGNVNGNDNGSMAGLPPGQPPNGNMNPPDPTVTASPPPPPPQSGPAEPTDPTTSTGTGSGSAGLASRSAIEQQYQVQVLGKDRDNPAYLETLRFALSRYPVGSMNGLQITLDEQSLDVTGGIGGYWTQTDSGQPTITIYQASSDYVHVEIHELAHNLDLTDYGGRITSELITAATSRTGQVAAENIPSPYALQGLRNKDLQPEYGAEVISWSLDTTDAPGFQDYSTWRPTDSLVSVLERYLEHDKIIWNR